jgi:predicted transcriptional regulator
VAKYTVELNDQLNQVLDQLAKDQKTPKTQLIRRAISVLKYLDDERQKGNRIVITSPEGKVDREIVLT